MVLDVGGFLGLGEHTIAVEMSQLRFVHDQNDPGAIFIAMKGTKESLEAAPEFDRGDMTDQRTAEVATPAATPPAAGTIADRWNRPAMQREGYQDVPLEQVTAETLTGATVYGPDDQPVGEVQDLVVGSNGKISAAIVDFGGFLGMGERRVEVAFDEMQIVQEGHGGEVRVNISATKDQLEARPEYKS